jgi:hypothetical protein
MDDIDEDVGRLQHSIAILWALLSRAAGAWAPLLRLPVELSRAV